MIDYRNNEARARDAIESIAESLKHIAVMHNVILDHWQRAEERDIERMKMLRYEHSRVANLDSAKQTSDSILAAINHAKPSDD